MSSQAKMFTAKVDGITYYFSTAIRVRKFLDNYLTNRREVNEALSRRVKISVDLKYIADINLYRRIEKTGFLIEYTPAGIAGGPIKTITEPSQLAFAGGFIYEKK